MVEGLDWEGGGPAEVDMRPQGPTADEQLRADIGARLWALGTPTSLGDYAPPWDCIGADLWARLLSALVPSQACKVAAPASIRGYAECVGALMQGAPAVHRALTDIRGLALAAGPVQGARKQPPKKDPPGEILTYEILNIN